MEQVEVRRDDKAKMLYSKDKVSLLKHGPTAALKGQMQRNWA